MRIPAPRIGHLDNYNLVTVFGFVSVYIFLIPIWYFTTAVYRAPLPDNRIHEFNLEAVPEFPLRMYVSIADDKVKSFSPETLSQLFKSHLKQIEDKKTFPLSLRLSPSVKIYQKSIALNPEDILIQIKSSSLPNDHVNVLQNNTVEILLSSRNKNDKLEETIAKVFNGFLEKSITFQDFNPSQHKLLSKTLKKIPYKSRQLVSFSLMNGNTDECPLQDWAIEAGIEKYFSAFIKRLEQIYDFEIVSQIQQYSDINFTPKSIGNNSFLADFEDLSHFVSNDWNLASATSSELELNFVLFVPKSSISPLYLSGADKNIVPTNSFLIPRAGGVCILNSECSFLDESALESVFSVFIDQLRDLLEIEELWPQSSIISVQSHPSGLTDWEFFDLLRRKTAKNVYNSADTLKSLSRMLKMLPNIVVNDHIASLTTESLYLLETSVSHYHMLPVAFAASKRSLELAEVAFFDPTMTALLYFPDEHLYAVYAPLFFPIAVPILIKIFKELRNAMKK